MGKMKEMFIIMKDDGMKDLDTLIKKAVRVNADRINCLSSVAMSEVCHSTTAFRSS